MRYFVKVTFRLRPTGEARGRNGELLDTMMNCRQLTTEKIAGDASALVPVPEPGCQGEMYPNLILSACRPNRYVVI
jgi:hypothetical protein